MSAGDNTWKPVLEGIADRLGETTTLKAVNVEASKVLGFLNAQKSLLLLKIGGVINLLLEKMDLAKDKGVEEWKQQVISLKNTLKRKRSSPMLAEGKNSEFLESTMGLFANVKKKDREKALAYTSRLVVIMLKDEAALKTEKSKNVFEIRSLKSIIALLQEDHRALSSRSSGSGPLAHHARLVAKVVSDALEIEKLKNEIINKKDSKLKDLKHKLEDARGEIFDLEMRLEMKEDEKEVDTSELEDDDDDDEEVIDLRRTEASAMLHHGLKELAGVKKLNRDDQDGGEEKTMREVQEILDFGGYGPATLSRTHRFEEVLSNREGCLEVTRETGYYGALMKFNSNFLIFQPPLNAHFGNDENQNRHDAMAEVFNRLRGADLNPEIKVDEFNFAVDGLTCEEIELSWAGEEWKFQIIYQEGDEARNLGRPLQQQMPRLFGAGVEEVSLEYAEHIDTQGASVSSIFLSSGAQYPVLRFLIPGNQGKWPAFLENLLGDANIIKYSWDRHRVFEMVSKASAVQVKNGKDLIYQAAFFGYGGGRQSHKSKFLAEAIARRFLQSEVVKEMTRHPKTKGPRISAGELEIKVMRRNMARVVTAFAVGRKMRFLEIDRERNDFTTSELFIRRLTVGLNGEVEENQQAHEDSD
jgi:hypothetical protein